MYTPDNDDVIRKAKIHIYSRQVGDDYIDSDTEYDSELNFIIATIDNPNKLNHKFITMSLFKYIYILIMLACVCTRARERAFFSS